MHVEIPFIDNDAKDKWGAAYQNEKDTKSGVYPFTVTKVWHTGIHLSLKPDEDDAARYFLKPLSRQEQVIAFKIPSKHGYIKFDTTNEIKRFDNDAIRSRLENAKENYKDIYDAILKDSGCKDDDDLLVNVRKQNVFAKISDKLSSLLTQYSTGFVLTKRLITFKQKDDGKFHEIVYFTLYSNLAPLADFNFKNEVRRCFFRKWELKDSCLTNVAKLRLYTNPTCAVKAKAVYIDHNGRYDLYKGIYDGKDLYANADVYRCKIDKDKTVYYVKNADIPGKPGKKIIYNVESADEYRFRAGIVKIYSDKERKILKGEVNGATIKPITLTPLLPSHSSIEAAIKKNELVDDIKLTLTATDGMSYTDVYIGALGEYIRSKVEAVYWAIVRLPHTVPDTEQNDALECHKGIILYNDSALTSVQRVLFKEGEYDDISGREIKILDTERKLTYRVAIQKKDDDNDEKRLAGYIQPKNGAPIDISSAKIGETVVYNPGMELSESDYIGMQGLSTNNAVHIEVFMSEKAYTELGKSQVSSFKLYKDPNNNLICDTEGFASTIEAIILRAVLEPLFSDFTQPQYFANHIYSSKDAERLYETLNKYIVKCRSFWEDKKEIILKDYGYLLIPKNWEQKYKDYVKSMLWMTTEVKDAMAKAIGAKPLPTDFYYFHPINFMRDVVSKLDDTFNPYYGKTIKRKWTVGRELDEKTEDDIKDNPGFAPKYQNWGSSDEYADEKDKYMDDASYAVPTGLFNQKYWDSNKGKEYPHEGVDFRGDDDTEIYSFIHGTVIFTGVMTNGFGMVMLVEDAKKKDTLYLLGHLSRCLVGEGTEVHPKMPVAKVGHSGTRNAHLHVSVLETNLDEIVKSVGTKYEWKKSLHPFYRNPFKHTEPRDPDPRYP